MALPVTVSGRELYAHRLEDLVACRTRTHGLLPYLLTPGLSSNPCDKCTRRAFTECDEYQYTPTPHRVHWFTTLEHLLLCSVLLPTELVVLIADAAAALETQVGYLRYQYLHAACCRQVAGLASLFRTDSHIAVLQNLRFVYNGGCGNTHWLHISQFYHRNGHFIDADVCLYCNRVWWWKYHTVNRQYALLTEC